MIENIASKIAEKMDLKEWNHHTIISKFSMLGEPTHKFILRINTLKDRWEFFVKVCKDSNLSTYLENEAKALEYLNRLGIRGIPDLILRDSYYGKEFLVQSFIHGRKVNSHVDIVDPARDWLLNLYSMTKKGYISSNDLLDKASEYIKYLSKWFDLGDILSLVDEFLPDEKLPLVFSHGDFWSDNMLLTQEGINLVDFSLSADNQPPLDIYTLLNYLSLETPEILASTSRLRDLTSDFLPSNVDPMFMLMYSTIRRSAQLTRLAEDLYDNMFLLDKRRISRLALYQIGLLRNISLKLDTR